MKNKRIFSIALVFVFSLIILYAIPQADSIVYNASENSTIWQAKEFAYLNGIGAGWTAGQSSSGSTSWLYQNSITSVASGTTVTLTNAKNGENELWLYVYRDLNYNKANFSRFKISGIIYNFIPTEKIASKEWVKIKNVNVSNKKFSFAVYDVTKNEGTIIYAAKLISKNISRNISSVNNINISTWFVNSLKRVYSTSISDSDWKNSILINVAGNELESFQLILKSSNKTNISASASSLSSVSGLTIDSSNVVLKTVEEIPTKWNSNPLKMMPDALPELGSRNISLDAGKNKIIWVTVKVPSDTPAGNYTGSIILRLENGSKLIRQYSLHVWNFSLSETHLKTAFDNSVSNIITYHNLSSQNQASQLSIVEKYYSTYALNRVSERNIRYGPDPENSTCDPSTRNWTFNFELQDKVISKWLDAGFTTFSVYSFIPKTFCGFNRSISSEKQFYEEASVNYWYGVAEHLAEKGWIGKAFYYIDDEPADSPDKAKRYSDIAWYADLLHKADPRIKVLLVNPFYSPLYGKVNIWVLPYNYYNESQVQERREAGDEVWWYGGCEPFWLNNDPIHSRALPWLTWSYNLQGTLYWRTNSWIFNGSKYFNPWKDFGIMSGSYLQRNGCGVLFYPPYSCKENGRCSSPNFENPVTSIRWEVFSDGIEDYEYFWLLNDTIKKAQASGVNVPEIKDAQDVLKNALAAFVKSSYDKTSLANNYNNDFNILLNSRAQVANAIEKLKPLVKT